MRSLFALSLILAIPLGLEAADGTTAPTTPAVVPGATDAPTMLANWSILQAQADAPGPTSIVLPPGITYVARPVQARVNSVALSGAGRELSTLSAAPGCSFPPLILNLAPPTATGGPTPADLAPGTLKLRYGLHLTIPWQAWSVPRPAGFGTGIGSWSDVPAFTIEFNADFGPTGKTSCGPVCGMANRGIPAPFAVVLTVGPGPLRFLVATTDGQIHTLDVPRDSLPSGPSRFSFQADTATGLMGCSINGVWRSGASPATFKPGLKFSPHDGSPMKFAGLAAHDGEQSDLYQTNADFTMTLTGARLSSVARYDAENPNANPAACKVLDAQTLAMLPMDDDPAYVATSRVVRTENWTGGARGAGCGFLVDPAAANPFSSTSGASVRDLTLRTGPHGFALMTATSLHVDFRDDAFIGGQVGFGNLTVGSNYTYSLTGRNTFKSGGNAIRLDDAIVRQTGVIQVDVFGTQAIHLTECNARFDDVEILAAIPQTTQCAIYSRGTLAIRSLGIDDEDAGGGSLDSIIHCDLSDGVDDGLSIDSASVASIPAGAAFVTLDSPDKTAAQWGNYRPGRVQIGPVTVQQAGGYRALVDCRDTRWYGSLDPLVSPKQPATPLLTGTLTASPAAASVR